MPLTTTVAWMRDAHPDELWILRDEKLPETLAECRKDNRQYGWPAIFRRFLVTEFATENLDFLDAIDDYRERPNAAAAMKIYDDFVKDGATVGKVNLSSEYQRQLAAIFGGDQPPTQGQIDEATPAGERDVFQKGYEVVPQEMLNDTYNRFKRLAEPVQTALQKQEKDKATVSRPTEGGSVPQAPPTDEQVNTWNEKALKALTRNTPTDFFQIGKVVIIANPGTGAPPPGAGWIQQQNGVVIGTITKRGGVFGGASIVAEPVQNKPSFKRADFEDALRAASSDIQFGYPDKEPPPKKRSAFGS